MSRKTTISILACLLSLLPILTQAQTLTKYEYWFDDNYSNHKSGSLSGTDNLVNTSVATDGLDNGVHKFSFRAKQSDGYYSAITSSLFLKRKAATSSLLEYWFDDNFDQRGSIGIGNTEAEQSLELDLRDNTKFPMGFHKLNIRVTMEGEGESAVYSSPVLKLSAGKATSLEYWIDGDITHSRTFEGQLASDGKDYIFVNDLDLDDITPGYHRLYCRAVSSSKRTTSAVTMMPILVKPRPNTNAKITRYSISIDNTPPATFQVESPADEVVVNRTIDASTLDDGEHELYMTFWNDADNSVSDKSSFVVDLGTNKLATPNPSTFKATKIHETGFTASWGKVNGALYYDILVKKVGGDYKYPAFNGGSTGTSIDVTGLEPNTSYLFQVRARNENRRNNSDWSPSIPNAVTTTNVGTAPAALVIHSNKGFDGSEPLTLGLSYHYNVWIANQEDHPWQGSFYLKDGNEDIKAWYNITIPKNSVRPLEFDYTPESVGSKSFVLYYQTKGRGSGIPVETRDGTPNIMTVQVNPDPTYNDGLQLATAIDCPESIRRSEKCKITAHVKNNGNEEWTGTLYIADNGLSLKDKEVTLAPGKEMTLIVNEWAPEVLGTHQIGVYYKAYKGFNWQLVSGNGFTNPISVEVLAADAHLPSLATITHISKEVEPTEVTEGSEVYYYFRITDEQGNRLKGVRVIFGVEGSTKRDVINTTLSDDNGLAVLRLQTEGSAAIAERGQTAKLTYQLLVDENNEGVQSIIPNEVIQLKIHQGNDVSEFTGYENVESLEIGVKPGLSFKGGWEDLLQVKDFDASISGSLTKPFLFTWKRKMDLDDTGNGSWLQRKVNYLSDSDPLISVETGIEGKFNGKLNILDYINLNGGIKGSLKQKSTYHANALKTPLAVVMGYVESIFIGTNNTTIKGIRALETWFGKKHGDGFFDDIIVPEDTYTDGSWGVNAKAEVNFLKFIPPGIGRLGGTKIPIPSFNLKDSKLKGYYEGAFTWEPEKVRYKNGHYIYGMSKKFKREFGGEFRILLDDFASPQKSWWKFASGMTNSFNNLNKFLKDTDSSGETSFAYSWKEEEMYTTKERKHLAEISNTYEIQTAIAYNAKELFKKYICSEWMKKHNDEDDPTSLFSFKLSNTVKYKMSSKGDWLTNMEEYANKNDYYNQIVGNIYPHFSSHYMIEYPWKHKKVWEDSNLLGNLYAIPANGEYGIKDPLKISMQNSSEFEAKVSIPIGSADLLFTEFTLSFDIGVSVKAEFFPSETYYSVTDRCFLPVVLRPSTSLESITKKFTGNIHNRVKDMFTKKDREELDEEYKNVGQRMEFEPVPSFATALENKVSPHMYDTNSPRIKHKHPMIAQNQQKDICNLKFTINDGTTNFEEGTTVRFEHYYPAGCQIGLTDEGDTLFVISEVCELSAFHDNDTLKTTHQGQIKLETYIGADDLIPFGFSDTQPLDVYYSHDNGEIWHNIGPAGTTLMVDSLGAYMLGIPISNDTEAPQITALLDEETGLMHINVSDNIGVRIGTLQVLVNGELREVSMINESNFELQLSEEEMQYMVVVDITVSDLAENEGRLFVVFNIDKPDNTEIHEVRDGRNAEINLTRRVLTVDGASPEAIVTVYSLDGLVQAKEKTDSEGHIQINLNSLLEGVYIVTLSDGKSKKFHVK